MTTKPQVQAAAEALKLADDIVDSITELADGKVYPDLLAAVRQLASMALASTPSPAVSAEPVAWANPAVSRVSVAEQVACYVNPAPHASPPHVPSSPTFTMTIPPTPPAKPSKVEADQIIERVEALLGHGIANWPDLLAKDVVLAFQIALPAASSAPQDKEGA